MNTWNAATGRVGVASVLNVQYWFTLTGTFGRGNGASAVAAVARGATGGTRSSTATIAAGAPAAPGAEWVSPAEELGQHHVPCALHGAGEGLVLVRRPWLVEDHVEDDRPRALPRQLLDHPSVQRARPPGGIGLKPERRRRLLVDAENHDLGRRLTGSSHEEQEIEAHALLEVEEHGHEAETASRSR